MVEFSFSALFHLFYFVFSAIDSSRIVPVTVFKTQIFVKRRVTTVHPQEKVERVAQGDVDKMVGTYGHFTNRASYQQHPKEHVARTKTRIPSLGFPFHQYISHSNLFPQE